MIFYTYNIRSPGSPKSVEMAIKEHSIIAGEKGYDNVQKEKRIIKYLHSLGIEMKTDPLLKEERYWELMKRRMTSTSSSEGSPRN